MLSTITWYALAVSHVSGIKIVLLDRTLKIPLVQGHSVVFGQNISYIKKSITSSTWKVPGVSICCLWSIQNLDSKCALVKNTHLYISIIFKNINENRISSQYIFVKSTECKLLIFILSSWTVSCMHLHFWALCGICSSYWRFSLYSKSLRTLFVYSKYTQIYIF